MFIRDWLRSSTIIGQKMAQPSARFLSSPGIRSISTAAMNQSTHPKQGLAKETPTTEVPYGISVAANMIVAADCAVKAWYRPLHCMGMKPPEGRTFAQR